MDLGVKPTRPNQAHRLVVKQYYASQSKGFHTCEQSRINAFSETSRIIDGEGHVMIFKRDGEVTVYNSFYFKYRFIFLLNNFSFLDSST